jgi:hypothetical protein
VVVGGGAVNGCLAQQAEAVLTDVVLVRMVAHGSILGPYRPTRPLIRGALNQVRTLAWRLFA